MENKILIEEFLKHKQEFTKSKRENGITEKSLNVYRYTLETFAVSVNKSFKEATEEDILQHLTGYKQRTKNFQITLFREFYQWLYGLDDTDPLPECIRKIKPRTIQIDEVKYSEKVVTDTEYNLLLENCTKPMYKAMIEALWCFGSRKDGIRTLLVKDVFYDGVFTKVTIREDKTQPRDVIFKGRCEHLLKWKESLCPVRNDPDAPLFVDCKDKGKPTEHYEQVGEDYIYDMLERMSRRAGLRHIRPHDLRHSCATRLLKEGIPTTHVCSQMGWKKNTAMVKVYDHNSIKDYQDFLLKGGPAHVKPTYEGLEKRELEHAEEVRKLNEKTAALNQRINEMGQQILKLLTRSETQRQP